MLHRRLGATGNSARDERKAVQNNARFPIKRPTGSSNITGSMNTNDTYAVEAPRKRRADRRMHRLRVVAYALRVARVFAIPADDAETWAKHNADNLKACSCWMCGHTRRWFGSPFRERKRIPVEDV